MWKVLEENNNYEISDEGFVRNKTTKHVLGFNTNSIGYERVVLTYGNVPRKYFIHRLVAKYFIPNPLHLSEVNHIDGDKTNNKVSNLEWCSRADNEHHARRTGFKEYKPYSVEYEDGRIEHYEFKSELARKLNVTIHCIKGYLHRESLGYRKYGIKNIQYL